MSELIFKRAIIHSQFELDRFSTGLDRLESYDYPSKSAGTRIKALRDKLKCCSENLAEIENDYPDDPSGSIDRINSEYRKLLAYRMQLEILDRARSDEVPWSLVPSIESISNRMMPDRDVLLTSTPEMTYMVQWDPGDSKSDITVYLPKLHRSNAFLHILIGHELFHPLVYDFISREGKNVLPAIRDECKDECKKTSPGDFTLFDSARLDQAVNMSLNAWETGLTELMCDMGAASLFGPAALWSLSAFASTYDQDHEISGDTCFYPTWKTRLKIVLSFLENQGKLDTDGKVETHISKLIALLRAPHYETKLDCHANEIERSLKNEALNCSKPTPPNKDPYIAIAYRQISSSLAKAQGEIQSITTGFGDSWSEYLDEIPKLLRRLALNVPPSEIIEPRERKSKPAHFTSIVNASWIERLVQESKGSLSVETYQLLNRLTLKAIEDSEIKKEYLKWSSTK
jgi:hypothetical protein